ncbi:MAG: N-acetylglucosamine-6-phosphate deacetylase [Planctomycetota bacterium]
MSELRGRLLVNGEFVPGRLTVDGGRIRALQQEDNCSDEEARLLPIIAPGLIDLHVHGYGGANPVGNLAGMARALAAAGTTGFVATTFPADPLRLGPTCASIWKTAQQLEGGARVLGLHVEGPFVNPRKAGALNLADLAEPSVQGLRALLGPSTGDGNGIRIATVAPELSGADELIAELVRSGVRVSLGHSLATAAEARRAARAGATGATHLYNAMSGVHHRDAGLATYALSDDALVSEIIGDLVHVGADAFSLALRARGPEGLALVSDALEGAGSGCDVFESHGHRIVLDEGAFWIEDLNEAGIPQPRTLTGAATSQLEAVRRLHAKGVCSLEDGLRMASESPARALGMLGEIGVLAPGARADLIVLAPNSFDLKTSFVGGRES